jgi:hypothetical protein
VSQKSIFWTSFSELSVDAQSFRRRLRFVAGLEDSLFFIDWFSSDIFFNTKAWYLARPALGQAEDLFLPVYEQRSFRRLRSDRTPEFGPGMGGRILPAPTVATRVEGIFPRLHMIISEESGLLFCM